MAEKYDFGAWATKANVKCLDGRTIMPNAFQHCDGQTVPIMWMHFHDDPELCVGKALLHNTKDGVYMYGSLNDSPKGAQCKELIRHGDIVAVSINANHLKETARGEVMHGDIKEVSLVLAGANPGALIDKVLCHSDDGDYEELPDQAIIYTGCEIEELQHSDDSAEEDKEKKMAEENIKKTPEESGEETIKDVFDTLTDKQKTAVYAIMGQALEDAGVDIDGEEDDEEEKEMKHNAFDNETNTMGHVLTHADGEEIVRRAKSSQIGSLQAAIKDYIGEDGELMHAATYGSMPAGLMTGSTEGGLFPDYEDVRPGAPEFVTRDQGWISTVMSGVHKSPISRIRTRQMDIRATDLRGKGYKKGDKKSLPGTMTLLKRTTDPQTVYRVDALNRDDIIDITEFDVVEYQYQVMKMNLEEELAMAIMVGDGREVGDDNKISEEHIRSIWHDDDLYCIHQDVDLEAAKKELQGTGTDTSFGENYIYAEALVNAALYSREKYKGSGSLTFFCTPHLLNVMLLARDMNGRRIYSGVSDLAAALNVTKIVTAEQFEGLTRTTSDAKTKELLGIFVNLADYHVGATKGGEITRFEQFDIDFNLMKYLIETRVSGALTRVYSAIALEIDKTE